MAKYADIGVKGSMDNIQTQVRQAFEVNGFKINWDGNRKGKAEKGSKGANIMLGALATHYVVDFEISGTADSGNVRLIKTGSGASGGLLGMRKANKQFDQLVDTLADWFKQQGTFVAVRKA